MPFKAQMYSRLTIRSRNRSVPTRPVRFLRCDGNISTSSRERRNVKISAREHTRYHTRTPVTRTSATAAQTSQMTTTALKFRKSSKSCHQFTAIAEPSAPPGSKVEMVKAQEVLKCVGTLTSGDYGKQGYSYCQPCIPRQTFDTVRKEELYGAGNDSLEAEEVSGVVKRK